MGNTRLLLIAAAFASNTACAARSSGSPEADAQRTMPNDPRAAICPAPDAASVAVTFDQIQQIFADNCIGCHGAGADLNLELGVSWTDLVNRPAPAAESCGGILVVPGDATASYLFQKLSSATPCDGSQMPRGDLFPDPLPACVVAMVEQWITKGAPNSSRDGGTDGTVDATGD
jgi:hypothetical protein